MPMDLFTEYILAMDIITGRESLISMDIITFPHLQKREDKEKIRKKYSKMANPYATGLENAIRFDDFARKQ